MGKAKQSLSKSAKRWAAATRATGNFRSFVKSELVAERVQISSRPQRNVKPNFTNNSD